MLILGLLLFAMLVVVHEFGHFLAARRSGVEVDEFGIGFPPRIYGKKFGKTLYSINLIPLGGFVKLKGEEADSREPGSFGAARYRSKIKIALAGVAMNYLAAFVLVLVLAFTGLPNMIPDQFTIAGNEKDKKQEVLVAQVVEDSAAAKAGIQKGAVITKFNDQAVSEATQLVDLTKQLPNQSVRLEVKKGSDTRQMEVTLGSNAEGNGQLGIVPFTNTTVRYGWAAPIVAVVVTLQVIWLTFIGLWQLLWGLVSEGTSSQAVAGVAGPISIFALLSSASDLGLTYLILLIISISISLAVLNSLPIPALDGGRIALISIFRMLKKPLTNKVESVVHGIGFALLMLLVIVISIFDIKRLF